MLGFYGMIRYWLGEKNMLPDRFKENQSGDQPSEQPKPDMGNLILDSCFLHVDGINNTGYGHDSNATVWKNLVEGQKDGTLYGQTPVWTNNACAMNGTFGFYFDKQAPTEMTIELVAEAESPYPGFAHVISSYQDGGAGMYQDSSEGLSASVAKEFASYRRIMSGVHPEGKFYTALTINSEEFVQYQSQNEPLIGAGFPAYFIEDESLRSPWTIGYNPHSDGTPDSGASLYVGKVYSVRIHSRALTAEEIAHNMSEDKKRFSF